MTKDVYRGKRKETGEWVYGRRLANDIIVPIGQPFEFEINTGFIGGDLRGYEVDPNTVGQCTELTDKNKIEIFEGDIIIYGFKPCVVKWDKYNASFSLYVFGTTKVAGFNQETMNLKQVAGNMYDSPELLEVVAQ